MGILQTVFNVANKGIDGINALHNKITDQEFKKRGGLGRHFAFSCLRFAAHMPADLVLLAVCGAAVLAGKAVRRPVDTSDFAL